MADSTISTGVEAIDGSMRPRAPDRVATLDILRGFALLGILLINILAFKAPWGPPGLGYQGPAVDRLVLQAVILLVESKFFTLFSLLFGLGFSIQLLNARAEGARFGARFLRRLAVLFCFGVVHVSLLWEGDILILYAITGLLLLLFRESSPRALLRWSAFFLLIPLVSYSAAFAGIQVARSIPRTAQSLREADEAIVQSIDRERADALAGRGDDQGGIPSIGRRVVAYARLLPVDAARMPTVLGMFLIGLFAGKTGIPSDVEGHLPLLRRIRSWGLGLGLPTSLLATLGYFRLPPVSALSALLFNQALAGPLLALAYAASLTLLARDASWRARLHPLAMTGRMSLTNYLGQSLACVLLFQTPGLGLAGRVSPLMAMPLAAAIFAVQVGASGWWMRRFRYGPTEWIWRSLTYGTVAPLRRDGDAG